MDFGIRGKQALVCGASKGLGRGCAEALAAEGVNGPSSLARQMFWKQRRRQSVLAAAAASAGEDLSTLRSIREQQIPARRFGNAAEFGAVCAFLCSMQAGYMTGQNVLLDGGAYPGTF